MHEKAPAAAGAFRDILNNVYAANLRRSIQANPSSPVASSKMLAGSGVVATVTSVRLPVVASNNCPEPLSNRVESPQ
jgi:hypothetical protein